jgi:16S rRNA (guanine527-N7)-methyltransferase
MEPPPALPPPPEFLAAAAEMGVEFEPGDLELLGAYLALLLDANTRFNLTSVTDPAEAWRRHVLDSLTLLPLLSELSPGSRIIDVGSGGGLPGVVLAIVLPQLRFTLLEATGKKAKFLRDTARTLSLANIDVVQERAEKAGQSPAHREQYSTVVARAVGTLALIAELTVPLVKVGGQVLLIKGERAEEELAAAKQALYLLHAHHAGTIHTATNRIVVLDKIRKTPGAYPRKEGEPKRAPLGT